MGFENEVLKGGGGYAGGFFHLFDWKAKSRKKLFSSKSDFPEHAKQGKKSDGNLPMTQVHLTDEYDPAAGSSCKGSSDYSYASSVTHTDDDGNGSRAPGVVARLMGLDSMPTTSEPHSTPFFDTQSLHGAHSCMKTLNYRYDNQTMYSGNLLNDVEGCARDIKSKPLRMLSRPIEKYQTEILPPKSAKSIPITHHKLLSPIKGHCYIPTKNAVHIMEAAAKILEPAPQANNSRTKMPVVRSSSAPLKVRDLKEKAEATQRMPLVGSSVPLKVRDLKEKVEAANRTSRAAEASQRPSESNAAKCLKGQSLNKSWNGSVDSSCSRASSDIEEGTSRVKNKGKSISLAIQAKVNVQRRESLNSSTKRNLVTEKEHKSSQSFKSQPNIQKNLHKKNSMHNSSGVLRQNNQKQNCSMDKNKLQGRKTLSRDSSIVEQKPLSRTTGNSKIGSRKLDSDLMDGEKEISYCNTKNVPRKKRSIDRDLHYEKDQATNVFLARNQNAFQSNPIMDKHFTLAEDSRKKGMDVVSFTFTAPLSRSISVSETSCQVGQKNKSLYVDNRCKRLMLETDGMNLSSLGQNVTGAGALSMLLEHKLRELSCHTDPSLQDSVKARSSSSSASIVPDPVPTHVIGGGSRFQEKVNPYAELKEKQANHYESDFSFIDAPALGSKHKFQGVDEMDECSTNHFDRKCLFDCQQPSPVSILEPSFLTESCNSSDSVDISSMEGNKHCSSVQAQEIISLSSLKKFPPLEADTELSDSASTTYTRYMASKNSSTIIMTDHAGSAKWDLEYVKQILCNVELMFQEFALGQAREIINPYLFDLLENRKPGLESDGDESRQSRKVLFDCVSESMNTRCGKYVGGGYRTWAKGVAMVRRKEWLAEEVYKEISGWGSMGDCMVDELVDKDMSSQYGRWLDFEVDAFALGVEVEGQIFNSLVTEVVADILQF